MKKTHVIDFFGSQAEVARLLNISESSVSRWPEDVPIEQAWRLERLSKGDLRMRINDYRMKALSD